MARVPHLARPGAWQKPLARIEGERILKARAMEQRVLEQKAKVEAEASRVEEMESQKLDEKVDDLREQLDRLTDDLPKILPAGGGGKRMVAKVLARDYPDLTVFEGLAKTDGNFVVADGAAWTVESGATARASLGLGTAATTDATDYATAAQGSKADTAMQPANNLSDVANAATARTNLGLGTSAVKNTGTSGDAVPLLNAANTWEEIQAFSTTASGTAPVRVVSSDAGASQGPFIDIARTSASPAASDALGGVRFRGMDSGGNETLYTQFRSRIIDPTDGSEDGALEFVVAVGGVNTQGAALANGFVVGAATGSYQGTGTVNATDYYRNGTALSSTLFGVAVGDASGNLKALNADGAFTFATTTTSANVAGVNSGTWKTAHRFDSTDTATLAGNRTTMAILRGYTGSGENGPTRSDTALHLEAEQDNWLTTSVLGESDTLRIFNRKGANGDMACILINVGKVESASYGSLAWEAASSWVTATTGAMVRLMRTSSGHQGSAADLRGGGMGFNASAITGDHSIAFAALQDHTDTGRWEYPFLGADGYADGNEYFYVTGPAHASGKGKLYTSGIAHIAGGVAAPAGGSSAAVIQLSSLTGAVFGIYFGSAAPTVSAAKGSLYLRRDGTTTNNRAYINTDGGTTWTAITTVA